MNIRFISLLLVTIVAGFVYIYWRSDFYKHDKFKVFLTLLSASAIIFGILAIIIQGFNYNDNLKQRDTESFTDLSKDFINDILRLFIKNQDMSYYYNELLDIKKITKDTERNLVKEHQISMLIFAKLASISYYLKTHNYGTITDGLLSRVHHILDTFFKNDIFINYWKEYKEKLAGQDIQDFVKKQYNI